MGDISSKSHLHFFFNFLRFNLNSWPVSVSPNAAPPAISIQIFSVTRFCLLIMYKEKVKGIL